MRVSRILSALVMPVGPGTKPGFHAFRRAFCSVLSVICIVVVLIVLATIAFTTAAAYVYTGGIGDISNLLSHPAWGRFFLVVLIFKVAAILIGIDGFIEKIKGESHGN